MFFGSRLYIQETRSNYKCKEKHILQDTYTSKHEAPIAIARYLPIVTQQLQIQKI